MTLPRLLEISSKLTYEEELVTILELEGQSVEKRDHSYGKGYVEELFN